MSASIYSEKLVEPDDKMLTYDLAETLTSKPWLGKSYFSLFRKDWLLMRF